VARLPSIHVAKLRPVLVDAKIAAAMFSVSRSSWWSWHSSGRCPAPIVLHGRTLWRVSELRRWAAAGCPSRQAWFAMRSADVGPRMRVG
jgi:predicted DNA-binding transcriptional regulator AlpA